MRNTPSLALPFNKKPISILLATAFGLLFSNCTQAAAVPLNFESQKAETSLVQLAQQANIQIMFAPNLVQGIQTPPLQGEHTVDDALTLLLQDSGLNYRKVSNKVFVIQAASEQTITSPANQPVSDLVNPQTQVSDNMQIETIAVTGSRIRRAGADAPIPTTVLDSSYIDAKGITNVGDMMTELPAINVGINGQNNNLNMGNAGLNLLDLRGLGYTRTLILVNGRRHVGSQAGNTAVDISTISPTLIDRVETITGGASSVYGADAVSGVVNFIMKRNYEGLQFDAQVGTSQHGGAGDQNYSITGGINTTDHKGNITFHLNYHKNDGLLASQRKFSRTSLTFQDVNGDGNFEPYNDNVIRITGPTGITMGNVPGGIVGWTTDGNFTDPTGDPIFGFVGQQGGIGLRVMDYAQPRPVTERVVFNSTMHYDLSKDVAFLLEGKYAYTTANVHGQPAYFGSFGSFARPAIINIDNPFLHPDVVNHMQQNNLPSLVVEKASDELGLIHFKNTRNLFQFVAGFDGLIDYNWQWSVTYQMGRSQGSEDGLDRDEGRAQQSIDAVRDANGNIVCRNPANGCVPMNLFGRQVLSQDVIDFMMFRETDKNTLKQQVFSANISGDLFELPAGALGVAAGVEYRKEASEFMPSMAHRLGTTYRTNSGALLASSGSYDVKDAFVEVLVPVLSNVAFAEKLSFDAAVRMSDYSTAGSSTAWKFGAEWQPVQSLRLRNSVSKSVRAPNIAELFQPEQPGFGFVTDPCHQPNRDLGANPTQREANCQALGLAADFQSDAQSSVRTILTSGNRELKSETSDTFTLGAVISPYALPDLVLSVDYWNIAIADAIQAFSADNVLSNCVDFASVNNAFCDLVDRNANGQITAIKVQQINIADFKASGFDFELSYRWPQFNGSWHASLLGSYLQKKDYYETPGSSNVAKQAGDVQNPQWQGMLRLGYDIGAWKFNWQSRYVGNSAIDPNESNPRYDRQVPSYLISNLQSRYQYSEDIELYFGINNVFDRIPPRRPNVFAGQGVGGSYYDTIGRFFYVGLRYKL